MTTQKSAKKVTVEELLKRIENLEAKIENLKPRDRGPASTRPMTDEDAERAIWGDLKEKSHKEAAKVLGLSYGQIYSARGTYTFKHLHEAHAKTKK